jgi:hypothetical protein
MSRHKTFRRLVVVLLLVLSLVLLAWGIWPGVDSVQVLPISPEQMQLPTPTGWVPVINFIG